MRPAFGGAVRARPAIVAEAALSRPAFVCRECLSRASSSPSSGTTFTAQRRGYAKKEPLTERLRQRIWGGNAPGPRNVYGEPQIFRNKEQKQDQDQNQNQDQDQQRKHDQSEADAELELAELDAEAESTGAHEAYTLEQAQEVDSSYEPAQTWDGLDKVGGPRGWWEKSWDEEHPFVAFRSSKIPQDLNKTRLFNIVRQAYVEASLLQDELNEAADIGNLPQLPYIPFHDATIVEVDGQQQLSSLPAEWRDEVARLVRLNAAGASAVNSLAKEHVDEVEEDTGANSAETAVESADEKTLQAAEAIDAAASLKATRQDQSAWNRLKLDSLPLRFAVAKRVMQLTGARLADAELGAVRQLGDVLRLLTAREPPRTTAALLQKQPELAAMPNVHIYSDRQTWVDREKRLGRYKDIVEQLEERGLPVPQQRRRRRSGNRQIDNSSNGNGTSELAQLSNES